MLVAAFELSNPTYAKKKKPLCDTSTNMNSLKNSGVIVVQVWHADCVGR